MKQEELVTILKPFTKEEKLQEIRESLTELVDSMQDNKEDLQSLSKLLSPFADAQRYAKRLRRELVKKEKAQERENSLNYLLEEKAFDERLQAEMEEEAESERIKSYLEGREELY